jgi:two-component system, sensor histidine kinase and response regulator
MVTILLVEDEAMLRSSVAAILEIEGYTVLEASDGEEALGIARNKLPDLIISDIMMPHLDGYGLLLALKEQSATASIPFIFLTAQSKYVDVRRGMSYGADDYLVKPVNPPELLEAIQTRLQKLELIKRQTEQRLEALRTSIITTLPHELLTPLTGIMGYVDLIVDDYSRLQPESMLRMLQRVQRASYRLHRLIQNYLLFMQLEVVGFSEQRLEQFNNAQESYPSDPSHLAPRIIEGRAAFYSRSADVRMNVQGARLRILPEDFQKIVEEVIDNAFKFSPENTPIVINGSVQPDKTYLLTVQDSGRGMTSEQIKSVAAMVQFERKRYEQQGSGLGLALAQRLVGLYNGTLTIDSTVGQGSIVKLTFIIL